MRASGGRVSRLPEGAVTVVCSEGTSTHLLMAPSKFHLSCRSTGDLLRSCRSTPPGREMLGSHVSFLRSSEATVGDAPVGGRAPLPLGGVLSEASEPSHKIAKFDIRVEYG